MLLGIILIFALFSSSFSCPEFPKHTYNIPPNSTELKAVLEAIQNFQENTTSGLLGGTITGISYKGELLKVISTGFSHKTNKSEAPTPQTMYRLASNTKSFMATLVMILREEGKLQLDDPITKYIPEFKIYNPLNFSSSFTIRQLLSHLSGLPREAPCEFFNCDISTEEILKRMKNETALLRDSNVFPSYSNFAYAWIGHLLETVSGMPLEDLLNEKIINVLGLKNTGITYNDEIKEKLATPYEENQEVTEIKSQGWVRSCGDMYSSLEDMIIYGNDLALGNKMFKNPQTKREFFVLEVAQKDFSGGFGLSWEFEYDFPNQMWFFGKSGVLPGYTSNLYLIPKLELVTMTLSTASGSSLSVSEYVIRKSASFFKNFNDKIEKTVKPNTPPNASLYEGTFFNKKYDYKYEIRFDKEQNLLILNGNYILDYKNNNHFRIVKEIQPSTCPQKFFNEWVNIPLLFIFDENDVFLQISEKFYGVNFTKINDFSTFSEKAFSSSSSENFVLLKQIQLICPKFPSIVDLKTPLPDSIQNFLNKSKLQFDSLFPNSSFINGIHSVSYRGKIIHSHGAGYMPNYTKPEVDTLFRIASITKLVTNVAIMIGLEKSYIENLDTPVTKYCPELNITLQNEGNSILTFRQLMNHLSGLSNQPPWTNDQCPNNFFENIDRINEFEYFIVDSYDIPKYSNLAFIILGRVFERAVNQTLEEFTQKEIFEPLHMINTGWNISDSEIQSRLSIARFLNGSIIDQGSLCDLKAESPDGQLYTSSEDFLKLLDCLVAENCPILSGENRKSLFLNRYVSNDLSYAIGLGAFEQMNDFRNRIWVNTKVGSLPYYNSLVVLVPEFQLTMTFFTTLSDDRYYSLSAFALDFESELVRILKDELGSNRKHQKYPENMHNFLGEYAAKKEDQEKMGGNFAFNVTYNRTSGYYAVTYSDVKYPCNLEWINDLDFQLKFSEYEEMDCQSKTYLATEDNIVRFFEKKPNEKSARISFLMNYYGLYYYKQEEFKLPNIVERYFNA